MNTAGQTWKNKRIKKINFVNNSCEKSQGLFFMKKFCIIFLLSIIIILAGVGAVSGSDSGENGQQFIRIHVRADSDDTAAQAVKYQVRDALVRYLTPVVAQAESYEEAANLLALRQDELSAVATAVLQENGFSYGATAALKREEFPTRAYGEWVLPGGEYLALVIELGEAKGQNWWCVIYPPLCFAGQAGVPIVYRSKIAEIIEKWKTAGPGAR